MAKKHFGRFMALAAIAGTAAAGISYFLRYKSFHKELDEDFHDFEDDFDEDLKEFGDAKDAGGVMPRNYVPLNTDRQAEKECTCLDGDEDCEAESETQEESSEGDSSEISEVTRSEAQPSEDIDSKTPDSLNHDSKETVKQQTDETSGTDAAVSGTASEEDFATSADEKKESYKKLEQPATIIIEDTAE